METEKARIYHLESILRSCTIALEVSIRFIQDTYRLLDSDTRPAMVEWLAMSKKKAQDALEESHG